MRRYFMVAVAVALASASVPAMAQVPGQTGPGKRATFIKGMYAETAASCQRLADIKAGRATATPYSTPNSITANGYSTGLDLFRFTSVKRLSSDRWRVVMAGADDGVPVESSTVMNLDGADKLVVRVIETALYWPADFGRGSPVPGQPEWRVQREKANDTATWVRCKP
jgi:hypothetical protein